MGRKERYAYIIAVLLSNPNREDAAKELNMSKKTLEKYIANDEFRQMYRKSQDEILTHVTGYLSNNIGEMAKILFEIATNPDTPKPIKLNAIKIAFEYSIKFTETNNVIQRIETLERECGIDES
ncbi:MAG: hypothetical protein K2N51_16955 [Lachnospiraceae bacterium]|nr:hypothetical protein [Lachnospiraceae bacterium]